jgi:hypothetical protein
MKLLITTLITLSLSGNSLMFANSVLQGTITGLVLDKENQPIPLVNALLLNAKDSTLFKGDIANETGRFVFEKVPDGPYLMMVSSLGYQNEYSNTFIVQGNAIALPTLVLKMESQVLDEFTVTQKKPFIEQEIDKTVINVSSSIVSIGSSALEVLERSPGVTIDQRGEQLNLNGQPGVIVQIDGKQTFLSAQEVVTLLRNMPSDNIDKIELITNPSAKYDAAGNSGIINIKLKRNINFGTNGNVNLAGGYGRYGSGTANGTLNRMTGKSSFIVNAGASVNKSFRLNDIFRRIPFEEKLSVFHQKTKRINKTANYNARVIADFSLAQRTKIGVMISAFQNAQVSPHGYSSTTISDEKAIIQQSFKTNFNNGTNTKNLGANLSLRRKTHKTDGELTVDVDYVNYSSLKNSGMNTQYFKPDGQQDNISETVRNNMPSSIKIGVVKFDYTQKLWKGKLETGLKSSLVATDNDMVFETKQANWIVDTTRSNHFRYKENLNALFLNYSGNFSKEIKFQVGLREEHTNAIGNSVTLHQRRARQYFNLFPSLFISAELHPDYVINASFSHRIDRPNYESLNPFEFYLDPYTIIKGNPNLKPQYTNLFQVVHIFKKTLTSTLSYGRIKDLIEDELPLQIASENKTILLTGNIDRKDRIGITISFPIQILKAWSVQTNLIGSYNYFKSQYLNQQLKIKQLTFNLNVSSQLQLGNGVSAELSGWYNTKTYYGMYAAKPVGMLNIGLQKSLYNKTITVRMNANDILGTNYFHGKIIYNDINYDVQTKWQSRLIRLALTYNFGNMQLKPASKRNTASDDLKSRITDGQ